MEGAWSRPKKEVLKELRTTYEYGLTENEVQHRLKQHGSNEFNRKLNEPAIISFLRQFKNPLTLILLLASIFAIIESEFTDAYLIITVVIFNAGIGFFQEMRSQKTIEKLRHIISLKCWVYREGFREKIFSRNLVIGDIIEMDSGDKVPADARILVAHNLKVSQSRITGEALPVIKTDTTIALTTKLSERSNMLYQGSFVTSGKAVAVVTATGSHTQLAQHSETQRHLVRNPGDLERQISSLSVILLASAIIIALITLFIGAINGFMPKELLNTAISLAVAIVPEGLPIAITATLLIALIAIYKQKAIIKNLSTIETLGRVTTICIDKTGTLTENQLVAEKLILGSDEFDVTGKGYTLSGHFFKGGKQIDPYRHIGLKKMLELISQVSHARVSSKEMFKDELAVVSDPIEAALAVLSAKAGYYPTQKNPESAEILEVPFTESLRYSSSVHFHGKLYRTIYKGSPDLLLHHSKKMMLSSGEIRPLLSTTREKLEDIMRQTASKGYQVLALAYVDSPTSRPTEGKITNDLVFVGFVSLIDPIRTDAISAIKALQNAGIKVLMITGDSLLAAKAVAEKFGILQGKQLITADEIRRTDLSNVAVIARASSEDKLAVIQLLQHKGEIVAMTGDGLNDAFALKKADVGISLGKTGTDVAIEASDVVILQNSLASIVGAISQGRIVWERLKKNIYFLTTTTFSEAVVVLLAIAFRMPLPLLAAQILWINLINDGLDSFTFAAEKEVGNVMQGAARNTHEPLVNKSLLIKMLLTSTYMGAIALLVFRYFLGTDSLTYARSATMMVIAFAQIANLLNTHSGNKSVFKTLVNSNGVLGVILTMSLILQLLVINIPSLQSVFHTESLRFTTLLLCITAGILVLFIEEAQKLLLRVQLAWHRYQEAWN